MVLKSNIINFLKYFSRNRLEISKTCFIAIALISLSLIVVYPSTAAKQSFTLLDARDRGVTETETAKGGVIPTYDEGSGKDVLEFDYTLPQGEQVTVWAKDFPKELSSESANAVVITVSVPTPQQIKQIAVSLALQGAKGTQDIPLKLRSGYNSIQEFIDWEQIGTLENVSFDVGSKADMSPVEGTLILGLDFVQKVTPAKDVSQKPATAKTAVPTATVVQKEIPSSFNVLDARTRKVVKTGDSKGSVLPTYDQGVNKDVLEFDYTIPKGSVIQISTKDFPEMLGESSVNTIRAGIRLLDAEQAKQISMKIELKGTKDVQSIPIELKSGWNALQEPINWESVGQLSEVLFTVTPVGETTAKGTMNIALKFAHRDASKMMHAIKPIKSKFNLLDAGTRGVFNIGPSGGTTGVIFDENVEKDVVTFDYTAPGGTYVGVWTQKFPPELMSESVDAVRIGVYLPKQEQVKEVAVKVEVKGEDSFQTIPLTLKPGWNYFKETINWSLVGELKEAVFVVSPTITSQESAAPMGGQSVDEGKKENTEVENDKVTGTLYFDLDFYKLTFFEKYFGFVKVVLIFLFGLLLAFLAALFLKNSSASRAKEQKPVLPSKGDSLISKLKLDSFYGMLVVAIGGIAFWIFSLGMHGYLDAGFNFSFLVVAIMGVAIIEIVKYSHTGKHITSSELFQNFFLIGLLAAASSNQTLWQAPATWVQLLMVSNVTASLFFLIYIMVNSYLIISSGKQLRLISAVLIVGTPFLFGWLLLAENTNLVQSLGNLITGGVFVASPAILKVIGRFPIVFIFTEAVLSGISIAIKGKPVKSKVVHLYAVLVSIGVVIAPIIADLGSTTIVGSFPVFDRAIITILTTMVSYAGLWGIVYLITGIMLDAGKRLAPSEKTVPEHVITGIKKGMAYSGILMAILYIVTILLNAEFLKNAMAAAPLVFGVLSGALIFPFIKTIIETFDGSLPFFSRVKYSYRTKTLYTRGAVVGFGFAYMVTKGMFEQGMSERILFGLIIGLIASGGVSIIRDTLYALRGCGKIQSWRLYFIDSILGIFVGSAAAFYLDARQVPVIIDKFKLYTSSGFEAVRYVTYPLVNKWGRIDLGTYSGGPKLMFLESMAGVINWAIAAWLFAINKVFLQALLDKDKTPIKYFFSKAGFAQLVEHMIYVLRWGLWMSPIIFTFLRMMPDPTWYNQDGAIRTLIASFNSLTMSPEAFKVWSLNFFVAILAFDFLRVLIWMDHMGLRVATLVNLSFIGLDKLDEKIAKFIGPSVAQRCLPEAVKRFCTWGPLLIPFYLPRGKDWDYAWSTSQSMGAANGNSIVDTLKSMPMPQLILLIVSAVAVCTGVSFVIRMLNSRAKKKRIIQHELRNKRYNIVLKETGEMYSEVYHLKKEVYPGEYDVTRRSYDSMEPSGRVLFLVDTAKEEKSDERYWPILGNYPQEKYGRSQFAKNDGSLHIKNTSNGIQSSIEVALPNDKSTAEIWTITLENLTESARKIKLVPYLEWVLNGGLHDRFHTQYARLFPQMEYVSGVNAVLAWQRSTKSMGVLAVDTEPEGFLTSRMDFIGRAKSLWNPRALETLKFLESVDTESHPTFDPIGSILVNAELDPKASKKIRLLIGYAKDKGQALAMIEKHLKPRSAKAALNKKACKEPPVIAHGEIPQGVSMPYAEYADNGKKLIVHTPFTPRPFDHAMSNAIHSVMVTNRGLHTSCNGNSQQNRLTPDWPDTVTKEVPAEAIYLYDPDNNEWFSPTYHPLNDESVKHESEFCVDGTAVFNMSGKGISTQLTVFVPPDDPTGVYMLTIKNTGNQARKIRISPYFQMVLEFQPERSGSLGPRFNKELNALFYENPRNMFRKGCAFVSMTVPAEGFETKRGRFFGTGRGATHPYLVEKGEGDATQLTDNSQIAAFLGTVTIPAKGESTVAIILGQTDTRKQAVQLVQKYDSVQAAQKSLDETRNWWLNFSQTCVVETNQADFDNYQNWLKYQALAERIWARRGFYQTSGAFGFRDQLQDTVNLIWVDPALARKQILLHSSHQFIEGDVYHWFFTLTDGRTAFACRSHASDNPLWLAWGTVEYVRTTGDTSILDERTSYVSSQFPFGKLPKNKHGWGHLYHRSTRSEPLYKHCMRSIDLVLNDRTGKHGLPLIQTGDWNDGLDEIGSKGKGESVWLGFFLYYIMKEMITVIEKKEGIKRKQYYMGRMEKLKKSLEATWRNDRYLRAFHDNGKEIGVEGSGIWETDALTAAWAVMCGINPEREVAVFNTALRVLEREKVILLGWPALREDSTPYLGRSSKYPEGVRENGMYCHGVQWLIRAARILAERFEQQGDSAKAGEYRETGYRLWLKITPVSHSVSKEIEIYGGQPNKQPADILTTFDVGRMIWNGYTGAAGWLFRQSIEGVVGATLSNNEVVLPADLDKPRGKLKVNRFYRDLTKSPIKF